MALFSRRKTDVPASSNPFVAAAERLAEQRDREAAEAAAAAAAQPVLEPRKGGRPTVANPRTRRVSMSLTQEEYESLGAAAEGRSIASWAREELLEKIAMREPHSSLGEISKLRADLGRVGSNLNQLVRAVNSGHAPSSTELLEAVQATREELARVRGELP